MTTNLIFGSNLTYETLEQQRNYVLVTQNPPFTEKWKLNLRNQPKITIFPTNVDINYLEQLTKNDKFNGMEYFIGFGGGIAIDTAKFLSWKWKKPLIQIPSIVSTDAFLTNEIGIRVENKVRYIGKVIPERVIIDYELIASAPKVLNYAGTCDVLSICTALGDWKIAHEKFGDDLDPIIYKKARKCAQNLLKDTSVIKQMGEKGIRKLVEHLEEEIQICAEWGSARPEEGGEHHLAYCIEELNPKRYLHGSLVALNILTVLRLQAEYAEFHILDLKTFFDEIGHNYKFTQIGITSDIYRKALFEIKNYVRKENLEKGIWYTENPFSSCSISELINWISKF